MRDAGSELLKTAGALLGTAAMLGVAVGWCIGIEWELWRARRRAS